MRAAVLALLLLCGASEAHAQWGGWNGGWGSGTGSGEAPDPTPRLDFHPAEGTGPGEVLSSVPTFTTMEEVIYCDLRDHTSTNVVCDVGGTWVEVNGYGGGSGDITPGYFTPLLDDDARSSKFFRAVVRAPNTTVGEITTNDFIAMVYLQTSAPGAAQTLFGKHDSAGGLGWSINTTSANLSRATVNGTSTTAGYTLPRSEWNLHMLICKHDGSAGSLRHYVNTALAGTAAICPALTSAAPTKNTEIGGRSNSDTDQIDGYVAFARVWKCPDANPQCMTGTTATMDAVQFEMASKFFGVWGHNASVPAAITLARASSSALTIVRANDTAVDPLVRVFDIGPNHPRIVRLPDEVGRDRLPRVAGYYPEPGQTNLALRSRQFGTTWVDLTAADPLAFLFDVLS